MNTIEKTSLSIVEELAKATNEKRKELGYSFEYIADKVKVAEGTIKNWCTFKTANPGIDSVLPVVKFLDISVDDVIYPDAKHNKTTPYVSDNALKEMCEFQMIQMKEFYTEQHSNTCNHYEKRLQEQEKHFTSRLADKDAHTDTIMLDKRWFRLASVFSVVAIVILFGFIEFSSPGHGWLKIEDGHSSFVYFIGLLSVLELIVIVWLATRKRKKL
jgi:transcriptional regulator with XRE-family HTH domain